MGRVAADGETVALAKAVAYVLDATGHAATVADGLEPTNGHASTGGVSVRAGYVPTKMANGRVVTATEPVAMATVSVGRATERVVSAADATPERDVSGVRVCATATTENANAILAYATVTNGNETVSTGVVLSTTTDDYETSDAVPFNSDYASATTATAATRYATAAFSTAADYAGEATVTANVGLATALASPENAVAVTAIA